MLCISAGEHIKPLALVQSHAEWYCLVAKMRPLSGVLLLLLLICQLVTPTPIFDRDGGGFPSRTGFGETIRDWFRVLKDRVVGKWNEWFGKDSPTPNLSPQDLLKIDKTLESRIPNYPGLFLDLSSLSFDPKRDWGVRIGKWYIIRKVTGDDDSESDEWDMRTFIPNLPLPPIFETDWTPDFRKFGIPQATSPPTTTPKIESTTSRQQTTRVTQTQSVLTPTESTTTEATVTSTESIPLTTQLITTSAEPIATSTEILTSSESVVTNSEPVAAPTEFTLTSTKSITEPTIPSTESTVLSVESISSTEPTLNSVKSVEIEIDSSIESTVITNVTSTEELTAITTTESPITSTELILPTFNKRVEDNETIDRQRTTRKPRPASAEVIMF